MSKQRTTCIISLFIILFTLIFSISMNLSKANAAITSFHDVPSSYWASKEISYLSNLSIVSGYKDEEGHFFAPDSTLTRAQAAKMIVTAKGLKPVVSYKNLFPDVPQKHWASGWIEKAVSLSIFTGNQDGTFTPNEPLTRGEMAKLLVKAFRLNVEDTQKEPFTDVYINDWYRPYISTLYQLGIASGSDHRFNPHKEIKRSEFAAFLSRTLNPDYRIHSNVSKPTNSTKTATVTTNMLNVRSGPSTDHKMIGKLSSGSTVKIYSIEESWAKISYNNGVAYVSTNYLQLEGQLSSSPPTSIGLKNKVIVLDAGHGGKDPGAVGNGIHEKDITLDVVQSLEKKVMSAGAKVILTRNSDTYPTLDDRVQIANRNNADIFVSVHVNSGPSSASGTETFYDSSKNPQSEEGKKLAAEIQKQIVSLLEMKDRGVKNERFQVITYTKMPSVLVELGFISNSGDAKKLADERELYAEAIYKGIVAYYNKQ